MTKPPTTISTPIQFPVEAGNVSGTLRRALQRIPTRARFAACFGSFALIVLAIYAYMSSGASVLNLICRHNLESADLSVFVDGNLEFTEHLSGTGKRRFGFLDKKVEGTLSKALTFRPGEHVVKVAIKSPSERFDQSKQIAVNMVSGKEATVVITAQRGEMTLAYQGTPVASDKDSGPTYFGSVQSILVTFLGSVASAAIAFMVQEFLRSRKTAFAQNRSSKLPQ